MGDGTTVPQATLEPMGVLHVQLGDMIEVGGGPKGPRVIVDVVSVDLQSDKIKASLATNDAADWLTVADDGKIGVWMCGLRSKQTTMPSFMWNIREEGIWLLAL